jgi:hypothetical protein
MTKKSWDFHEKPDYKYWSVMARWNLEWLAALSLDHDPNNVSLESVQSNDCPQELRDTYLRRHAVIENHKLAGRFQWPVDPVDFLSWLESNGFGCPPALEKEVEAQRGVIADWKHQRDVLQAKVTTLEATLAACTVTAKCNEKPLQSNERASLQALVIAMAVSRYHYNPKAKRSDAPNKIWNDVTKLGLKLGDDTVRKYLNESSKMLEGAEAFDD